MSLYVVLFTVVSCGRSPQVYLEKGNRFAAQRKYQDASIQYRKAIQRNAQFGEAFYQLGLSEWEQGNLSEAYRQLSRAVELMPDNDRAKVKLADLALMMYWANPRKPKAPYELLVKLTNQLLAKPPESFDGLRLKGSLAMLDRQPKLAMECFERANRIKPMQAGMLTEYVQALLEEGQDRQAEDLARQVIARERTFKPIYDVVYAHYLSQKRVADAERLLREKVQNNPADSDSILQLARHYHQAGNPDQMQAALRPLIDNPKVFPKGHLQAGELLAQFGDWDKAVEQFEAGARQNPGQAPL
jgi:tetratricopeptide (TPR) repeat protein